MIERNDALVLLHDKKWIGTSKKKKKLCGIPIQDNLMSLLAQGIFLLY